MLKSIFSCKKLRPTVITLWKSNMEQIAQIRGYYTSEMIDVNTIPFGWHIIGFRPPGRCYIAALDEIKHVLMLTVSIDKVDTSYIISNENTWAFLTNWRVIPPELRCPKSFGVDRMTIAIANPVLEEESNGVYTTMLSLLGFNDGEKRVTLDTAIKVMNSNDTIVYDVQRGTGYKLNDLSIKELTNYEVLGITDCDHPVYRMATDKKVIDVISRDLL